MANERNPNSPYDPDRLDDPTRSYIDDRRSPVDLDNDLQPDPELAEGPVSSAKITVFAIGVAVVLGAVFYGLNHSSVQQASTVPAPATAQNNTSPPAAPAGMRDVTPRANSNSGVTTGSAPAQNPPPAPAAPATAPASK
jgi:hypothetical protein